MRYLALLVLLAILTGCTDAQTWDTWVNHGQPNSCHGSLTADVAVTFAGPWGCGGNVYEITASVRDYDGALIGRTAEGFPVVGYLQ